ncbi:MAG: glutamate-ammonia-ligase adenylyltransferase [Spirochaetales bacterium]
MASGTPSLDLLRNLNPALGRIEDSEAPLKPSQIVARLPEHYFAAHDASTVARHVELISSLSRDEPYAFDFAKLDSRQVRLTVVTFDHPGLLSLLAGMLGSAGLDIKQGNAFTMSRAQHDESSEASTDRATRGRGGSSMRHGARRQRRLGSGMPAIAPLPARRIVDHFVGELEPGVSIATFLAEMSALTDRVTRELLASEREATPRRLVDEAVARKLRRRAENDVRSLYPLTIDFESDEQRTTMVVTGQDTPFFLYALGAALSFQKVMVESVSIVTVGHEIKDTFFLADVSSEPIRDQRRLDRIRFSVLLTKQFTHHLGNAPDPYAALVRFESLSKELTDRADHELRELIQDPYVLSELARLLGASDFLWEDFIRLQYENVLPLLRHHDADFSTPPEQLATQLRSQLEQAENTDEMRRTLNEFKDGENFRIDVEHILRPDRDFFFLSHRLTTLAEAIVEGALAIGWKETTAKYGVPRTVAGLPAEYAVFGLGKLGGRALGYASDLELLFVYSDSGTTDGAEPIQNAEFFERFFTTAVSAIETKREGIFAVDLRLRPYGSAGPHAVSLESLNRYYGRGGEAHSYERLALTRLRAICGDSEFGRRVELLRDELVYAADAIDLEALRDLRARQLREKTRPDAPNAKFSPGGLVDLEYGLQILLVTHGRANASLRTPSMHTGLDALGDSGLMDQEEVTRLKRSYQFLRRLINGLRMLRGNAQDLFLPETGSLEYAHLARRMGYAGEGELDAAEQLRLDFESRTAAVRAFVEHHLGRKSTPGNPTGNAADLVLTREPDERVVQEVCRRARLGNVERAVRNLHAMAGSGEEKEAFAELVILAWTSLATNVDPDMALNNWERFTSNHPDRIGHYRALLHQPRMLELMLQVFAASQFLANTLIANHDFLDWALDPKTVERERSESEIVLDLTARGVQKLSRNKRTALLRKQRKQEILRIGTRDLCLGTALATITREISALARALLQVELESLTAELSIPPAAVARFCILAFGKLGGNELNYSSDIDLLGVYDPDPEVSREDELKRFSLILTELRKDFSALTIDGYVYRVDFRLRPYGTAGPLVQPRDAVIKYYREHAGLWEHQALIKLAPVAGNMRFGFELLDALKPHSLDSFDHGMIAEQIRDLRNRAERHSAVRGHDIKNGPGGIRDIEFLVQGLQMKSARRVPQVLTGNSLIALERLAAHGVIEGDEATELAEAYSYLRRIEHLLQLFEDRQEHSLPEDQEELARLARRMEGSENTLESFRTKLEETQRRVRERYLAFVESA